MIFLISMRILITGFGPFGSIINNPSSILGQKLSEQLNSKGYTSEFIQLRTAIKDCIEFYENKSDPNTLIIHIGVNSGIKRINIEFQGFNEAIFSIPDADGAQPFHEKIINDYPYQSSIRNKVDLQSIIDQYRDSIDPSYSAGRYICNYIYFLALYYSGIKSKGCVFVHIPLFENLSLDKQLNIMNEFISSFYLKFN